MNKPTTYEEVCKFHGIDKDFLPNVSSFPEKQQKMQLALWQWDLIRLAINGDWIADPTNHSQDKYEPWAVLKKDPTTPSGFGFSFASYDYTRANANVGSRLGFESSEAVFHALKYFSQYYINFLIS